MAEHPAPAAPVHPSVRFETKDINPSSVVKFGVGLVIVVTLLSLALIGLYFLYLAAQRPRKEAQLPPAAGDERGQFPPPLPAAPAPEAPEDLKKRRFELYPPRAHWQLGPEEGRLDQGTNAPGALPLEKAIAKLAQKGKEGAPPPSFRPDVPSRAGAREAGKGGAK
jgi:hypothetical protein